MKYYVFDPIQFHLGLWVKEMPRDSFFLTEKEYRRIKTHVPKSGCIDQSPSASELLYVLVLRREYGLNQRSARFVYRFMLESKGLIPREYVSQILKKEVQHPLKRTLLKSLFFRLNSKEGRELLEPLSQKDKEEVKILRSSLKMSR